MAFADGTSRNERLAWQARRLDKMRKSWLPMKKRVDAAFKANPDISDRAAFAKLPFDIAFRSTNEKVILAAIEMMRKMNGHDERTVNVHDKRLDLDERVEVWKKELDSNLNKLLPAEGPKVIDAILNGSEYCVPAALVEKLDAAMPEPKSDD